MRAGLVLSSIFPISTPSISRVFHLALLATLLPAATGLSCYYCDVDSITCDATHPGNLTVTEHNICSTLLFTDLVWHTSSVPLKPIYMQDCEKEDPPAKVPNYCFTMQAASEPSLILRGCVNIQYPPPQWNLPEPPVGGAVCVDVDTNDHPPQKVFNE